MTLLARSPAYSPAASPAHAPTQHPFGSGLTLPTGVDGLLNWNRADETIKTGGARQFDTTNSEFFNGTVPGVTATGTIAMWLRPESNSVRIASIRTDNDNHIELYYDSNNLRVDVTHNGTLENNINESNAYAANTWTFVLITWGASGVYIYRDNSLVASDATDVTDVVFGASPPIKIGAGLTVVEFDGRISKAGVWSAELDSDARTALFSNGNGLSYAGLSAALKSDLLAYYNLNEASGNAIDAHGSNDLTDNNTVTAADGPTVEIAADIEGSNPGVLTGFAAPSTAWSSDSPKDTFNPTAQDTSGESNHCRLVGYDINDSTRAEDNHGSATGKSMPTNGTDQYVSIGQPADLQFSTEDFDVTMYVKRGGTGRDGFFGQSDSSGNNNTIRMLIEFNASNVLRFIGYDGTTTQEILGSTVTDSNWHKVQVTRTSGTVELFLDDVSEGTATIANSTTATEHGWAFGRVGDGTWSGAYFDGDISDLSISIGGASKLDLTFSESNTRDWIDADAGSVAFDGTDDYITAPASDDWNFGTSEAFTIATWVKYDTLTGAQMLLSTWDGADGWELYTNSTTSISMFPGGNITVPAMSTGVWYHIAVARPASNTAPTVYINSVPIGQLTSNGDYNNDGNALGIGADIDNTNHIDAKLHAVGIWDTEKSESELYSIYTGTDDTTGRVSFWPLNDGPQSPVSDGDPIIEWESKEGTRYQFKQATAAKRPAAALTTSGINNRDAVEFDGSNLLVLDSAPLEGKADLTLVIAIETGSTAFSAVQVIFATSDEATATTYMCVGIDSAGKVYVEVNNAGTVYRGTGDTVLSTSTTYVITVRDNDTAWGIDVNETAQTLTDTGTYEGINDISGLDNTTLGALKHASEVDHFEGKIADSILYNPDLDDSNETKVEDYATSRYGV